MNAPNAQHDDACRLCGGTAGRMIDGVHCLCAALALRNMPTPCLGFKCPVCHGSGRIAAVAKAGGRAGLHIPMVGNSPYAIGRIIDACFPKCMKCRGTGTIPPETEILAAATARRV